MLTDDQFDTLPQRILSLYAEYEDTVIRDIARRLAGIDYALPTAAWQMQRLTESGRLYESILSELEVLSGKTKTELRAMFEGAGVKAIAFDDGIYKAAGLHPLPLNLSPAMAQVLEAGLRKTNNVMQNLTLTTASAGQDAFINAADLAYMQVSSGSFDYNSAIRQAVKSVADQGLEVINFSGRHDQLDVAMRRTVLTGVSQTTGDLQIARADEMGCDLVAVSAHVGARNKGVGPANHESWQGKVYSRSGTHPGYKPFVETTGYGTGEGLCGYNCRHSFYPFFEGISENAYSQAELKSYASKKVTYNGQEMSVYDATQQQRAIERKIRHWKRQEGALRAAGVETIEESAEVKEWQERMRDFSKQTGLQRQYERERIFIPSRHAPGKKIDFASSTPQYIADLGDIANHYSPGDPGKQYVVTRPVFYNSFGASHLTDDAHKYRLNWLTGNQEGLVKAIQSPDFIEKDLRPRNDGHFSATLIKELRPGTKDENRFMTVAVSLSLEPGKGYHQITTIHPASWKALFYADGTLKPKYLQIQ